MQKDDMVTNILNRIPFWFFFVSQLKNRKVGNKADVTASHMSGAMDGREKIMVQKLGHPILAQPILSQKM